MDIKEYFDKINAKGLTAGYIVLSNILSRLTNIHSAISEDLNTPPTTVQQDTLNKIAYMITYEGNSFDITNDTFWNYNSSTKIITQYFALTDGNGFNNNMYQFGPQINITTVIRILKNIAAMTAGGDFLIQANYTPIGADIYADLNSIQSLINELTAQTIKNRTQVGNDLDTGSSTTKKAVPIAIKSFIGPTTTNYTPTTGTEWIHIMMVGGGGGGGGALGNATAPAAAGAGGGGGGFIDAWYKITEISIPVSLTAGGPGNGGAGLTVGTAGGTSIFGSYLTASGGDFRQSINISVNNSVNASGGSGGIGTVLIPSPFFGSGRIQIGEDGENALVWTGTLASLDGLVSGGSGGSSAMGGGARGRKGARPGIDGSTQIGLSGKNYGGGGGGTNTFRIAGTITNTGGNGAPGAIFIYEY